MVWPLRLIPLWRMFFSRRPSGCPRQCFSAFLVKAACMSTCSMKCTPPRKSSPRYMGKAWRTSATAGERDNKVQRHHIGGSVGSGFKAFCSASLAFSWVVRYWRNGPAPTCHPAQGHRA